MQSLGMVNQPGTPVWTSFSHCSSIPDDRLRTNHVWIDSRCDRGDDVSRLSSIPAISDQLNDTPSSATEPQLSPGDKWGDGSRLL